MIKISREGKRFLFAVFIIGFAASNTGNNLIYLIFSMMFSILLLSLILPNLNLRGLYVDLDVDEPIFAGTPTLLNLNFTNKKRYLSSFSFRCSLPLLDAEGIYIDKVGPGQTGTEKQQVTFPNRGLYTIREVELSTEFPFIFFAFTKRPEGKTRVLVYPRVYDVSEETREFFDGSEGHSRTSTNSGDDLFKVRQFRYGDEVRSIHWKATARTGRVMVKEFSMNESEKVTIYLDNLHFGEKEHFEKAVAFTASVAAELLNSTYAVRLITCQKTIPFGTGAEHLYKILDLLAIIHQHDAFNYTGEGAVEGSCILVLSSESSPLIKFAPMADRIYYAGTL